MLGVLFFIYNIYILIQINRRDGFGWNSNEKYPSHVYWLLDIVIIFPSRGGMSLLWCIQLLAMLQVCGRALAIFSRIVSDYVKRKIQLFDALECFTYWFLFYSGFFFISSPYSLLRGPRAQVLVSDTNDIPCVLPLRRTSFVWLNGILW